MHVSKKDPKTLIALDKKMYFLKKKKRPYLNEHWALIMCLQYCPLHVTNIAYVISVLHSLMDVCWLSNEAIKMRVCELLVGLDKPKFDEIFQV